MPTKLNMIACKRKTFWLSYLACGTDIKMNRHKLFYKEIYRFWTLSMYAFNQAAPQRIPVGLSPRVLQSRNEIAGCSWENARAE